MDKGGKEKEKERGIGMGTLSPAYNIAFVPNGQNEKKQNQSINPPWLLREMDDDIEIDSLPSHVNFLSCTPFLPRGRKTNLENPMHGDSSRLF